MIKRILKMFGICMALLVILGGIGVGIYALTGGFNRVIIDITKLYIDDETKADKEIYTLSDYTTMINCAPFNATSKKLEVIVSDPLRVVDKDGVLIKEGVLKNIPKTVNAGEEFTLEVNKDSMGNNIGGVATLTFRPADKDKVVTDFTLKVVVDVAIPNNSLYFAGNDGDVLTTTGKNITMGLSSQKQNVYLKSNLVNAFCLETSNGNLKQAVISYVYKNQKGDPVEEDTFTNLEYQYNYNEETKEYNYYYEVPFTPKTPGTINVTARMHRTYEIEQAYIKGNFDNIPDFIISSNETALILQNYNNFINYYKSFFDDSEESYNFFKGKMNEDGSVALTTKQDIDDSKKFIFQTCSTTITVTAVNLTGITSIATPKSYNVFDTKTLYLRDSGVTNNNIPSIIEEFDLKVTLSENEVANIETEQKNLFTSLKIRPYIYVEKEEYKKNKDTLWSDYKNIFGVERLEKNNDDTNIGSYDNYLPMGVEPITFDQVNNYEGVGFLLLLDRSDESYKDYIDIDTSPDLSNKSWTFNFNVPMRDENKLTEIPQKALFLEFEVTGRDLDKNVAIVRNTYSRIYINYESYEFNDIDNPRMSLTDGDGEEIRRMSINKKINNVDPNEYSEILYKQYIKTDLSRKTVSNYDKLQYKSIMYFVEDKSNGSDTYKKVATLGKYNFKLMNSSGQGDLVRLDGKETLVGQRLLNEGTREDPKYNLYAVNASKDPVKIFAVVYLSDKEGNPIDVNGKKINIKEDIVGSDPTTLVILAITADVTNSDTMQKVYIDSFVENINYYTESVRGVIISDVYEDNGQIVHVNYNASEGYVKRNNIASYRDENGNEFSSSGLKKLQDLLSLKLLYNYQFELIVTNLELDSDGRVNEISSELSLEVTDFNGNKLIQAYSVDTGENKQLALNNMCDDENKFKENFELFVEATNNAVQEQETEIITDRNDDVIGIKYVIKAQGKREGAKDIYFREKTKVSGDDLSDNVNYDAPNALEYSNYMVGWKVTEIKTSQVDIENTDNHYFDDYEKLYSIYAPDAQDGYKQEFGTVTLSPIAGQGLQFNKYYFKEMNTNQISSDNNLDKFTFNVTDNLGYVGSNGNYELNYDVVDISQSVFKNSSINPEDYGPEEYMAGKFPDISSYREYYLNNSNKVTVTCDNPVAIYQLTSDLVFDKIQNGKLCINDKQYDIKNDGNGDYIIINNQEYFLMDRKLTINANKFVPAINDNTVIILGEEFKIYTIEGEKYIYSVSEDGTGIGNYVIVVKTEINPNNYLDTNSSMWSKDVVDGKSKLYINFKKGGVLTQNGSAIFVKDENGKYRIDNKGNYVVCDPSFTGEERYAKKGIPVFLMIRIKFQKDEDSAVEIITKAMEFELIQEDINLVVTDNDGNAYVIPDVKDEASTNPPKIKIEAGTESSIGLKVGNPNDSKTINLVGASFENTFYKYCTFKLEGANGKVIFEGKGNQILAGNQINELPLKVADMYGLGVNTGKLYITYPITDTESITRVIGLDVNPNFKFGIKEGKSGTGDGQVSSDSGHYIIKLDSTDSNGKDIQELLKTYFETDEGKPGVTNATTMSLTQIDNADNNVFASISDDGVLKIGKSYAIKDLQNQIIRDSFTCTITLYKDGETINVDQPLKVIINPTYIFDFSNLNGISIISGQSLLNVTDYIKVYNGNSSGDSALIPKDLNLFTIKEENEVLTNGVINGDLNNWMKDQTKNLTLTYTEGLTNKIRTVGFTVTIKGFEVYYSPEGEYNKSLQPDDYYSVKNGQTLPEIITLDLYPGISINLDNYFVAFTCDNGQVNIGGESKNINLYVGLAQGDADAPVFNVIGRAGVYSRIVIARKVNDKYIEIIRINNNKTVTINQVVDVFFDELGDIVSKEYDALNNDAYRVTGNITIDGNENEIINLDNFLKIFVKKSTDNNHVVGTMIIKSGSTDVNHELTISDTQKSYKIYCKIDNVEYDTGYNVILNPVVQNS